MWRVSAQAGWLAAGTVDLTYHAEQARVPCQRASVDVPEQVLRRKRDGTSPGCVSVWADWMAAAASAVAG